MVIKAEFSFFFILRAEFAFRARWVSILKCDFIVDLQKMSLDAEEKAERIRASSEPRNHLPGQ